MPKFTLTTLLSCCLAFFPLMVMAQTCNPRIPATTPTSRYTQHANGTVVDKDTGLMWKTCREGQIWNDQAHSCELLATEYGWTESLQYIASLNKQGGFAGYSDWRLPNVKELLTLVERQCVNPAVNLAVFPNFDYPWTAQPSSFDPYSNRIVDFMAGRAFYIRGHRDYPMRLVRDQ